MSGREIKIFPSVDELNHFAADEFVRLAREAIVERGQFTVALSGGSTPKKLYALLASDDFRDKIEWRKIHVFFGDERSVPPDSDESNYRMVKETLLSKIEIPGENVHRFLTEENDARVVAGKMESEMREFFQLKENEFPRFDLILLGMGADGHTASLFPGTTALAETRRIVVENYVSKFKTFRLTFTVPTINNARRVIFLVAGEDKAEILRHVLEGGHNARNLPTQTIQPKDGDLVFLIDKKSASLLTC